MFIFHFHDNGPRRPGIQMIEQGQPCPQVAQQLYCKQPDWRKNILELSQQRRSRDRHDHVSCCVNCSLKAAGPAGRFELWSSTRSRERQSTATWCSHPLDSPAPDHRVIASTDALRIHMSTTGVLKDERRWITTLFKHKRRCCMSPGAAFRREKLFKWKVGLPAAIAPSVVPNRHTAEQRESATQHLTC